MKSRLLPPRYLNLALVLALVLHFAVPIKRLVHPPYTYAGIILLLLGITLNIWSVAVLKSHHTTLDFHGAPAELVTDGPFRFSRNPLYLSGVTLSLGVALLFGSLITFLFPAVLWFVLNGFYIPAEEAILEKTFGRAYSAYKARVRRWL